MSAQHPNGVRFIGFLKLLTAILLILGSFGAFHFVNRDLGETAKHILNLLDLDTKKPPRE